MPQFRCLQTAYVFDAKVGSDRLVDPGEIIASDLDLDVDKAIPTGESPDSNASKIFERVVEA